MNSSSRPANVLRPWTQAVRLNADVESGNTSIAASAIDLGSVIAGVKSIPKLYREAEPFFQVTYPIVTPPALMGVRPAPSPGEAQTRVRYAMTLNRQQIYASFNAFGNLAEKAGTILVTVEAHSLIGFDPVWLRNTFEEPLQEADVEIGEESETDQPH